MDYKLYVIAIICFVIAALPYMDAISIELLKLDYPIDLTFTVILVALGLILTILGYAQRPRHIIATPEVSKLTVHPSQTEKGKPKTAKRRKKTRRKS